MANPMSRKEREEYLKEILAFARRENEERNPVVLQALIAASATIIGFDLIAGSLLDLNETMVEFKNLFERHTDALVEALENLTEAIKPESE